MRQEGWIRGVKELYTKFDAFLGAGLPSEAELDQEVGAIFIVIYYYYYKYDYYYYSVCRGRPSSTRRSGPGFFSADYS